MDERGATTTACSEAYEVGCFARTLLSGDVVIMVNLSCHKKALVERLIQASGAEVRHLPAHGPDLDSIEEMFRRVKEFLRTTSPRTIDTMGDALRAVNASVMIGLYKHAGCRYV